jgi:hypothetical protein
MMTIIIIIIIIIIITQCRKDFLEKLTVPQLVMKFPAFNATRRFNIAFTRAHHLPLL